MKGFPTVARGVRWPDRFQPEPSWDTQLCALICVQLRSTACGWRACCPLFSRKAANKSLAAGVAPLHPCSLCGTADNPPREPHQNAILRVKDTSTSGDAIENVAHVLRARGCRGRSCPNREAGRRPPGPSLLLLASSSEWAQAALSQCFAAADTEIIDVVLHFPPLRQEPPHPRQNVPKCNCELNRAVIRRRFRPKEHGVQARHLWEPASVEVEAPLSR